VAKRFLLLIGVTGLASTMLFASTAFAGPFNRHGLNYTPNRVDFGNRPQGGPPGLRLVDVQNNTNGALAGGTYELTGDTQAFRVDLTASSCDDSTFIPGGTPNTGTLGITVGLTTPEQNLPLSNCSFVINFVGGPLPAGRYTADLVATFGDESLSVPISARVKRR
jgi:hypothetical protein